jgi:hypothetical protein
LERQLQPVIIAGRADLEQRVRHPRILPRRV